MSKSAKIMARFIVITSLPSPCANATLGGSFPGPNLRGESEIEKVYGRRDVRQIHDHEVDELVEIRVTNAVRSTDTDVTPLTFREWCDAHAFASAHFSLLDAMRGNAAPIGYYGSRAPSAAKPGSRVISLQSPHIAS